MGAGFLRTATGATGAVLLGLLVGRFSVDTEAIPAATTLSAAPAGEAQTDERLVARVRALESAVWKLTTKLDSTHPPEDPAAQPERQEQNPRLELNAANVAESVPTQRAMNENEFQVQPDGSPWAREKEQLARAIQPRTGRLAGFSCRASLCRLDVLHANGATATDFLDELEFSPLLSNATLTVFPSEAGQDRSVMFLRPI